MFRSPNVIFLDFDDSNKSKYLEKRLKKILSAYAKNAERRSPKFSLKSQIVGKSSWFSNWSCFGSLTYFSSILLHSVCVGTHCSRFLNDDVFQPNSTFLELASWVIQTHQPYSDKPDQSFLISSHLKTRFSVNNIHPHIHNQCCLVILHPSFRWTTLTKIQISILIAFQVHSAQIGVCWNGVEWNAHLSWKRKFRKPPWSMHFSNGLKNPQCRVKM